MNDDAGNPFAELLEEYVAECAPLAQAVGDTLVTLERQWEEGDPADQLFATLKGSLHTLKGNSAMMGLTAIQGLAHCMEDVCAFLGERPGLRPSASGLLLRGAGVLVEMVGRAARGPLSADRSEAFINEAREFIQTESVGAAASAPYPERRRFERRTGSEVGELGADGVVSTIRVDARRLDGLLETFGETMIAGLGLREAVRDLAVRHRGAGFTDLEHALTSLEKTLKRLEGALMATRLVSIATVFGRFNLLVREVANAHEKRVRLVTSGGETQLDKTVIDRLGEPLVHLVTNAIIHGLELPADRERAGKASEATITLSAVQRSDRVILTVTDDGRGLDPERILHKARQLGAVTADATLSRDEVFALAFLPGLSTTERVSALAGRGVGLDVVANSIRTLGGNIEVASEPGKGTKFTMSLPLTLAVLRSLLVAVDGERYAVPLGDVAESLRVTNEAIHEIDGHGMMFWRGQVIPVSDAAEVLGGTAPRSSRTYCVVVRSGAKRRGMLVDGLLGHQDVVVKALDPSLGRPPTISGATILGDGRVACILDTARFAELRTTEAATPSLS